MITSGKTIYTEYTRNKVIVVIKLISWLLGTNTEMNDLLVCTGKFIRSKQDNSIRVIDYLSLTHM